MKIYTNTPTEEYFLAIKDKDIIDSRAFYMLGLKLFNEAGIVRKILGRKEPYNYNPNIKDIVKSIIAPFMLLFEKRFIVLFQPYAPIVFYLLFLKMMGKDFVYMSSWPYWDGSKFPYGPRMLKPFWELFCNGTRAVCVSKTGCMALRRIGANAVWIPHSIDTNLFKPEKREGSNKGIKKEKIKVLHLGRLVHEKGIQDLLKLSGEINAEFVFAGEGGDMEEEVKKAAEEQKIVYLGSVRGIVKEKGKMAKARIYKNADIFVVNSYATDKWEELFGIAIIEAMASGLAVVASDCVGPKEIIKDGENGLLFRQRDYEGLKSAVQRLIWNKKLRMKLARNAKKTAMIYDKKIISKKWRAVLNY
ncbi:glycosyltransferase family 4 protein [archaeon]|nr:glycosyltransferase family 4 protein [archaeon]